MILSQMILSKHPRRGAGLQSCKPIPATQETGLRVKNGRNRDILPEPGRGGDYAHAASATFMPSIAALTMPPA